MDDDNAFAAGASGARVQFKGSGTVNRNGHYRFMLTAIGGRVSGGGGTDKFRIRIWGDSGLVYDNQMNAPDSADPTTVTRTSCQHKPA